jgi:hypothetical protein
MQNQEDAPRTLHSDEETRTQYKTASDELTALPYLTTTSLISVAGWEYKESSCTCFTVYRHLRNQIILDTYEF